LANCYPRAFLACSVLDGPTQNGFDVILRDVVPMDVWLASFRIDVEAQLH